MNNTITLTVELCAEDRARLDCIIALLGKSSNGQTESRKPDQSTQKVVHPYETESTKNETPGSGPASQNEPTSIAGEPENVTLEALQVMVQELIQPGSNKRDSARQIILSYAKRVGLIPEEKRAEVMAKLIELKEGMA